MRRLTMEGYARLSQTDKEAVHGWVDHHLGGGRYRHTDIHTIEPVDCCSVPMVRFVGYDSPMRHNRALGEVQPVSILVPVDRSWPLDRKPDKEIGT